MWLYREFKTYELMKAWLAKHAAKIQWVEIFVNNRYAIEYRKIKRVY
jgi:hypothetical protein